MGSIKLDKESKSTTVTISAKYKVEIDSLNHTLYKFVKGGSTNFRKGVEKVQEDRWVVEGYYPNMWQCLNKVINMDIAAAELYLSLHEYAELFKKLERHYK